MRHTTTSLLLAAAIAAALLAAATSCRKASGTQAKPVLAVSIEPQRYILEKIVGNSFDIVTILDNGANPETFDPTVGKRVAADKAVACFGTGHLPFETVIARSLSHPERYVDTSAGIEPVTGTHSHAHHDHGDGDDRHHHDADDVDPHVWTSVSGARVMAANMAEALAAIYPDSADTYRGRARAFAARLDSLDASLRSRLAGAPARAFAVWHPSLSYYARDYGLRQIAVGTESKEVSLTRMRQVADSARAAGVKVLFFQKEYDSRQAEAISSHIGSRIVTINPLDYQWEQQLNLITDEIARH